MQKIDFKKMFRVKTKCKMDEENSDFFTERIIALAYRKISEVLVDKYANKFKITPNQITITRSIVFLPLVFYFFQRGDYLGNIIGFCLAATNNLFDVLDGQLARSKEMTSKVGALLDDGFDRVTTYLIFSAIFLGSYHSTHNINFIIFGIFVLFFYGINTFISEKFGQDFGGYLAFFDRQIKEAVDNNKKATLLDKLYLNLYGLFSIPSYLLFAIRYQVLIGAFLNIMPYMIYYWTFAIGFRTIYLFLLYAYIVAKNDTGNVFIDEMRKIHQERTAMNKGFILE